MDGRTEKWREGLSKTRKNWFANLFARGGIDNDFYDELEEALILADTGVETTQKLLGALQRSVKDDRLQTRQDARDALKRHIETLMTTEQPFAADTGACVTLIIGVNGVGKTTTIGKLAHIYRAQGKMVMLAAADTFRAAAAEQLATWAERADVPMVRHQAGADPAAVVFDAIASYKARGCDLLLCDTAGRLHNKQNLMAELEKMQRVIRRELPDTPLEVLLVLDATTGQNAVMQAKAFSEVTALSGIVLTKLDGTAKGGVVIHICDRLHIPVRFVGVGEKLDDLQTFDPQQFSDALF